MKIQKDVLLSALMKVKPGLAKKEIIEQAQHFIFSNGEVTTFNDQVCVMHPIECDFDFSVKGEEFYKIISGISEKEIDLTMKESTLHIKAKGTNCKLSTLLGDAGFVAPLVQVLRDAISSDGFWKKLPTEFLDGLYLCALSASKDLSTGVKSCVAIKGENIYSTDGLRASLYVMDSSIEEIMIPARDALELIKYNVTEYGASENWMHFRTTDGTVFNCKSMRGDYPYAKVDRLFEDAEPTIMFPDTMKESVSSVLILAEGDVDINKTITVSVKSGSITCHAEKERGSIDKTVECDYSGDAFSFDINPIFFAQILSHAPGLALFDNRAMFLSDNFWHVIALPAQ
jgi:DNA polymerase III sliding clamp (beta) subunit (PCNA family)